MINVRFQDDYRKCDPLVTDDKDLRTVLNILHDIDTGKPINLKEIGLKIFNMVPGYTHGWTSVQVQALANLGEIVLRSDKLNLSRDHLYEKIYLIFFRSVE